MGSQFPEFTGPDASRKQERLRVIMEHGAYLRNLPDAVTRAEKEQQVAELRIKVTEFREALAKLR